MNSDNIYKGLKYVAVWILLYFFVKRACGEDLSDIDAALIAAVLTLLLCILENMYNIAMPCSTDTKCQKPIEHLGNAKVTGDFNVTGAQGINISGGKVHHSLDSVKTSTVDNASGMSIVSTGTVGTSGSSNVSSDMSSDMSSNSTEGTLMPSGQLATSATRPNDAHGRPLEHYVPTPSSQALYVNNGDASNYTQLNQKGNNQYYVSQDYLGDKVMFNRDNFGGTSTQLNEASNTDFGGSNSAQMPSDSTTFGGTDVRVMPKPLVGTEGVPNIHIPVPRDGSGKVFVRPDSAILSVDGGSNQSGNSSSHDSSGRSANTNVKWHQQVFDPRQYSGAENLDQIAVSGGRTRNNLLVNEMIYSDFNRMPPSFNDKDFEYGYSYLPPKDWYPLPPYPPVCSSNTTCPVQPVYLDTETMNLKEWHETQKITPPDPINTDFITNEMNSRN